MPVKVVATAGDGEDSDGEDNSRIHLIHNPTPIDEDGEGELSHDEINLPLSEV